MSNELSVIIGNYSRTENVNPDVFTLHEHDVYELMYFEEVNAIYFIEGKTYRLKKHDLLLIPPSRQHRIIPELGSNYERYDIVFDEAKLPKKTQKLIPSIIGIINVGDDEIVPSLLHEYKNCNSLFDDSEKMSMMDALMRVILYRMYRISENKTQKQTSRINPIVTKATEYIRQNLTSIKSVDEICSELFVTKSHLHHIFKKNLMTTPKKYITSKRLYEAQRLIRSGVRPSECYLMCGFDDYATFFRNYKAFFSHSPSDENKIEISREQYFEII